MTFLVNDAFALPAHTRAHIYSCANRARDREILAYSTCSITFCYNGEVQRMKEPVSPGSMCLAQPLPNSDNIIKCEVNGVEYRAGSVTYFDESVPVIKICQGGNEVQFVLGDTLLIDSDESSITRDWQVCSSNLYNALLIVLLDLCSYTLVFKSVFHFKKILFVNLSERLRVFYLSVIKNTLVLKVSKVFLLQPKTPCWINITI